ncbi:hypothetical protein C8J56DRAFT_859396 [Mycena floridula]|nr:hypothetical protein C8J56DRAFT_859396 [Mycena floridula]
MTQKCRVCGFSATSEAQTTVYKPAAEIWQLLRENLPLSEAQETDFQKIVVEGDRYLEDLNSSIAKMRHDLQGLIREREEKEQELRFHKSVLHPLRRLPNEILSEIFLSFINEDLEQDETTSSLDPLSTQWVIPRVSKYWRWVALSLSRMWSTIRLTHKDFDSIDLDDWIQRRRVAMLEVQLSRSGSHQLSVFIASRLDVAPSHPLLQLLFPTSDRWKDLLIFVPVAFLPAFAPIRGSLSSLHTLHVWSPGFSDQILVDRDIVAFELAPKLTTLIGNPYIFLKLLLPYAQITTYECNVVWSCHVYVTLLSVLTNLQNFVVDCDVDIQSPLDAREGIANGTLRSFNLPNLHSAVLRHHPFHISSDCALLPRVSLPALEDLNIPVCKSLAELRAMLQRSRCFLDRLYLAINGVPEDDSLVELLDEAPSLISFTVNCAEAVTAKLIDDLIQNPSVLPSLQFLKLRDPEEHDPFNLDLSNISNLRNLRPTLSVLEIDGVKY